MGRGAIAGLKSRLRATLPGTAARYLQLRERVRHWRQPRGHLRGVFSLIHTQNMWGHQETVSGFGSTFEATRVVRRELPALLAALGVRSLLDAPCGDCHWLAAIDLGVERYVGVDIVPELIEDNRRRLGGPGREFAVADLTADPLPAVDLILCRDCLIHLSYFYIGRALANFRRSGATWLLTTHYPGAPPNHDILSGQWRPLDLAAPPFHLPPPHRLIVERQGEEDSVDYPRTLGLWRIADLPR
jgi:hypothetical protein